MLGTYAEDLSKIRQVNEFEFLRWRGLMEAMNGAWVATLVEIRFVYGEKSV